MTGYTVTFVRTDAAADTFGSTTWTAQVPNLAEAHVQLRHFQHDQVAVSATAETATGQYAGMGVAGGGRCRSDWA